MLKIVPFNMLAMDEKGEEIIIFTQSFVALGGIDLARHRSGHTVDQAHPSKRVKWNYGEIAV